MLFSSAGVLRTELLHLPGLESRLEVVCCILSPVFSHSIEPTEIVNRSERGFFLFNNTIMTKYYLILTECNQVTLILLSGEFR